MCAVLLDGETLPQQSHTPPVFSCWERPAKGSVMLRYPQIGLRANKRPCWWGDQRFLILPSMWNISIRIPNTVLHFS